MTDVLIFFLQVFAILTVLSLIGAGVRWLARKLGVRIND